MTSWDKDILVTEPNLVTGSYIVKSEHTLERSPLEMAVAGMEGQPVVSQLMRLRMNASAQTTSAIFDECPNKYSPT